MYRLKYLHKYERLYIHTYMCVCVCVYVCICVCVYIYIYTHIHTYISNNNVDSYIVIIYNTRSIVIHRQYSNIQAV